MFKRILKFLQLTDRAGDLSITNVAVIVLITKIALAATLDWATAAGLLIALLNYSHKRHESNKSIKDAQKDLEVSKVESLIQDMESRIKSTEELYTVISKQADDVQKIVRNHGLSNLVKKRD